MQITNNLSNYKAYGQQPAFNANLSRGVKAGIRKTVKKFIKTDCPHHESFRNKICALDTIFVPWVAVAAIRLDENLAFGIPLLTLGVSMAHSILKSSYSKTLKKIPNILETFASNKPEEKLYAVNYFLKKAGTFLAIPKRISNKIRGSVPVNN